MNGERVGHASLPPPMVMLRPKAVGKPLFRGQGADDIDRTTVTHNLLGDYIHFHHMSNCFMIGLG